MVVAGSSPGNPVEIAHVPQLVLVLNCPKTLFHILIWDTLLFHKNSKFGMKTMYQVLSFASKVGQFWHF